MFGFGRKNNENEPARSIWKADKKMPEPATDGVDLNTCDIEGGNIGLAYPADSNRLKEINNVLWGAPADADAKALAQFIEVDRKANVAEMKKAGADLRDEINNHVAKRMRQVELEERQKTLRKLNGLG